MLTPNLAKWQQNVNDLFRAALAAAHPRTRERFLALYHLAGEGGGATAYAGKTERDRCTVMDWVHRYNEGGPQALIYKRSGGPRPFFRTATSAK